MVRPGFTMLELILVLVILALAAGLVVPALNSFARGRQMLDGAGRLLAVMQYAQTRAMNSGRPQRLRLDPNSGNYWVTARNDGQFVRIATDSGQTYQLPAQVQAAWDAPVDETGQGYVEFDPDGGHDVVTLRLTDARGSQVLIACASPAEPYRIITGTSAPEAR